jgi:hypothetical protein
MLTRSDPPGPRHAQRTGITLFNKIKRDERYQDIPIIIVTGIYNEFVEDHKQFFETLKLA